MATMRWSIFCRVVDNFGDIGFAWRLSADLAARGEQVRLAVDDRRALVWMAPAGAAGVEVLDWDGAAAAPADVLVETFGCGLPDRVEAGLVAGTQRPVCINVEHLSAEAFVERSHGLPSPRFSESGEKRATWFFYPGFSERTGGLLREPGLPLRQREYGDGREWLASMGIERREAERCVSLFCYRNPALGAFLDRLAETPTLVLLTPGPATEQARSLLGPGLRGGALRAICLPALPQPDFDRLLWSCDLNFVRGEDSLVRAIWAGVPFVWQLYPQEDGAHAAKLDAFLDRFLQGATVPLGATVRATFAAWNGIGGFRAPLALPEPADWTLHCRRWRERLAAQPDLASNLLGFVTSKR
jgi:uncharacterized repeat protein (TIGR03837 family)